MSWIEYFEQTKDRKPSSLLQRAVSLVSTRGEALDLGAGALVETEYLVNEGFTVTAVDVSEEVREYIDRVKKPFSLVISSFEDYDFPRDTFSLVNARYSLPFTKPQEFNRVWSNLTESLKKDAVFVGQFFGPKDDWSSNEKMNFHTPEEVTELLKEFDVDELTEEEKDQKPAVGEMKHWHVFHIIAKKK